MSSARQHSTPGAAAQRQATEPRGYGCEVLETSETAEKVRHRIPSPLSRQHIRLGRHSQARRRAVSTSHFGVDRIAAGEIDFFSGLVDKQHFAMGSTARLARRFVTFRGWRRNS
jgi:hypothetical protein